MPKPVLSAVMLVYNSEKYLREAIDSVLSQSFRDFEFIIINDGSTDKSLGIIHQYKDDRIRLINNLNNLGIPASRNIGLQEAKGDFLAWCDSDDINFPDRFSQQMNFLKNNGKYGLCGTWQLSAKGKKYKVHKTKSDPELVKAMLLFKPSIMNPTAMYRLELIKKNNLSYNTELAIAEDHDFFLRCSMYFPITNVQKVLVKYRASETSIIKKFKSREKETSKIHNIIYTTALSYIAIKSKETDLITHSLICSDKNFSTFLEFQSCHNWLLALKLKNVDTKVYDPKALNKVLSHRFYVISKKASVYGSKTFTYYLKHSYKDFGFMSLNHVFKLAFYCAKK